MHNPIVLLVLAILGFSVLTAVFKIIKSGFKLMSLLGFVVSISVFLFGIFLYVDILDFQDNFENSTKMFLLSDNESIITGFEGTMKSSADKPLFLSNEELDELSELYTIKDYSQMLGDNFKLFIINENSFNNLQANITIENDQFTLDEIQNFIKSEQPIESYVDYVLESEGITENKELIKEEFIKTIKSELGDDDIFKAMLFGNMISSAMETKGPLFLLINFQYGRIMIEKETLLFKTIKYIPPKYLESLMEEENKNGNTRQNNGSEQAQR